MTFVGWLSIRILVWIFLGVGFCASSCEGNYRFCLCRCFVLGVIVTIFSPAFVES